MKKLIVALLILIVFPLLANASSILQDPSFYPKKSDISCIEDGSCSLDQGFNTFIVLTKWGMGMLGSFALLFFIVGGIMWLTSGGKAGQIEKGKSIMINTVIGIIIVMSAWLIVQTVLTSISKRSLSGLDGTSQTQDLCKDLNEGSACRGNLGVCERGICVQKCDAKTTMLTGDYACREFTQCKEETIIKMYCFGPNNIVCCQP